MKGWRTCTDELGSGISSTVQSEEGGALELSRLLADDLRKSLPMQQPFDLSLPTLDVVDLQNDLLDEGPVLGRNTAEDVELCPLNVYLEQVDTAHVRAADDVRERHASTGDGLPPSEHPSDIAPTMQVQD